jgi:membrane-associated phospholipid phosphatase
VAVLAATLGWLPLILGPRTPPAALAPVVQRHRPALVGLSVTVALVSPDPRKLFREYAKACGEVRWLVGGAMAENSRDAIEAAGGRVFGGDAEGLRALLEEVG